MKRHWFFIAVHILLIFNISAQVRGKVAELGPKGDTTVLTGVLVNWLGTQIAVYTDGNGDFSIPLNGKSNRLLLSVPGYSNDTLEVKEPGKFMFVKLRGAQLDEVEIVYLTGGTEISYLNPIKTEVLNERYLMKAACCNLSESFETNPSIDVNFADAISGTRQIQMLGLSGQYAQITKENMPYLRGLAGNYGLTFIPGTWIQSIQLSKGAGSVVNGYESFTGQINTELRDPENSDKVLFNAYGNQSGRNEYNLNASRKLTSNLATAILAHTSYNPLAQDHNHDHFADIPKGNQYNVMNKYAFRKSAFEAQVGGGYMEDKRDGGQFKALLHGYNDSVPLYKTGIYNRKWELYGKTGFVFRKKPGTSTGLQLSYLDHDQTNFYGNNKYQGRQKTFYSNYIFQGIIGTTDHMYKTGLSYMDDEVAESFNTNNYYRHERVAGVFLEYARNYKDKLNLVAGIRGDYHNYYGLFFTPRLHLRYAFTSGSILRFSGGRALRTANIFSDNSFLMVSSRVWSVDTSHHAMPYGLKPETAWNYGVNFTQKFKINYRDAYVTLDIYRTDFSSQVVVDVDHNPQQVLIYNLKGPSFSNTAQFEFNMEPRKRLLVKTAYRYVDTRVSFRQGLLQKSMVSTHRAFINLAYQTKANHWQFDFTTQYNGRKRLPQTVLNPDGLKRPAWSPDYFNLQGQITYLTKIGGWDFNLYAGFENLLDYKQYNPIVSGTQAFGPYFDASMVWGPVYGRMVYAGIRLKLK